MDANGDLFEAWCRAGEREEDAFCVVCCQTINCAFHGVTAVKRHSQSKKHLERTKQLRGPDGKLERPAAVQAVLNFSAASTIASIMIMSQPVKHCSFWLSHLRGFLIAGETQLHLSTEQCFQIRRWQKTCRVAEKKCCMSCQMALDPTLSALCLKNRPSVFYSICIDETPLTEQRCQQMDIIMRYFPMPRKWWLWNTCSPFG